MEIKIKIICNDCGGEMEISSTNMKDSFCVFVNVCKECKRDLVNYGPRHFEIK